MYDLVIKKHFKLRAQKLNVSWRCTGNAWMRPQSVRSSTPTTTVFPGSLRTLSPNTTHQKQISLENNAPLTTLVFSGPLLRRDLLNWMLATSCQKGHLDLVRLLVHRYGADAKDCATHSDEFAVITGLPLYAAAQASKEMHTRQIRNQ